MTEFPLPGFLEVEIGAYCNRRCAWCPNGWDDRGQRTDAIAPTVWRALLDDLSAHRFRGLFAFHNYNEPLADPALFDRLADARAALPHAALELHTNGDYLDPAMLDALVDAGVAIVRVTLYPTTADAMKPPDVSRIDAFLARLDRVRRGRPKQKATKLEQTFDVDGLSLIVRVPKIAAYHDRAGAAPFAPISDRGPRTSPCRLPFHSAAIDVHGNLKLCCHVYDSTSAEMKPYVLGNVGEVPFTELWRSPRMRALRLQLADANFDGLSACGRCAHETPAWMAKKVAPWERQLRRAPPPGTPESDPSPAAASAGPRSTARTRR